MISDILSTQIHHVEIKSFFFSFLVLFGVPFPYTIRDRVSSTDSRMMQIMILFYFFISTLAPSSRLKMFESQEKYCSLKLKSSFSRTGAIYACEIIIIDNSIDNLYEHCTLLWDDKILLFLLSLSYIFNFNYYYIRRCCVLSGGCKKLEPVCPVWRNENNKNKNETQKL